MTVTLYTLHVFYNQTQHVTSLYGMMVNTDHDQTTHNNLQTKTHVVAYLNSLIPYGDFSLLNAMLDRRCVSIVGGGLHAGGAASRYQLNACVRKERRRVMRGVAFLSLDAHAVTSVAASADDELPVFMHMCETMIHMT